MKPKGRTCDVRIIFMSSSGMSLSLKHPSHRRGSETTESQVQCFRCLDERLGLRGEFRHPCGALPGNRQCT